MAKQKDGINTAISLGILAAVVYVAWANWDSLKSLFTSAKVPGVGQTAVPAGNYVQQKTTNRLDLTPAVSVTNPDLSINNTALGLRALSNLRGVRFAL